jgi:hypothetical protein
LSLHGHDLEPSDGENRLEPVLDKTSERFLRERATLFPESQDPVVADRAEPRYISNIAYDVLLLRRVEEIHPVAGIQ